MTKITLVCCLIAPALACALHADPARAQTRVFVSTAGSDTNPCTVSSPCRTFAQAYSVAATNAEIDVLTPGGYGSLTINKAISIQGHGFAGISVAGDSGTGIYIQAPSTDAVSLNGLLIDGGGSGGYGIWFVGGKSLTIENCVVRKMKFNGLTFAASAQPSPTLAVSNSYFSDNGASAMLIDMEGTAALTASIDRTGFYGNGSFGLLAQGAANGTLTVGVADSVASNTSGCGFCADAGNSATVVNLALTHSLSEGNGTGVGATSADATVWLAQSTLTGNTIGYNASGGGVINTYTDNYNAAANGTPTGTLTGVGKQ